jgi:hypothetical protein
VADVPKSIALPHTLKIQHHRVPEAVRAQLVKANKNNKMARHFELSEELQRHLKAKFLGVKAAGNGSSSPVPLENYNDWLLIANITIGTPAQTVRVALSHFCEELIVIDANGDTDCVSAQGSSGSSDVSTGSSGISSDYGDCDPKNAYNVSQSSTASVTNASLSILDGWVTGILVNDVVNIGDLDLNITLGDSDNLEWMISSLPIDGVLGLSASPSAAGIPNVLQQLVGQLAKPLLVLNTHRNISAALEDSHEADPTERNELTLGTDQVDGCSSDWSWNPLGDVGSDSEGGVSVTSVSGASASDGSANSVNVSRLAFLAHQYSPICTSLQVLDLIINATGAQLNDDVNWYVTPCDQVSQGQNVNLNLANGGAITLTPADLHVKLDDVCYLYVVGWYDENSSLHSNEELLIGQQFANNHCVAYNIAENLVGVSDKVSA